VIGGRHPLSAQRWVAGSGKGKLGRCWATPAPSARVPRPPSKAALPRRQGMESYRSTRQLPRGGTAILVAASWLL